MTQFEATENLDRVKEVMGETFDDRTILKALTIHQNDFERAINYLLEGNLSSSSVAPTQLYHPTTTSHAQHQLRQSITDAFTTTPSKLTTPNWARVPPPDNFTTIDHHGPQSILESANEAREPLVLPNSPPKGSYQPLTVTGQTTPTEDFRISDQAFQLSNLDSLNTRINHHPPGPSQTLPNLDPISTDIQLIDDSPEKRYEAELNAAIEASLASDASLKKPPPNHMSGTNPTSLKDLTAEDEQMSKALEESLAMSGSRTLEADGKFSHPHPNKRQRAAGRPTALRVHNPHLVFLPCVLAAIYAAKPFRDRILAFEPDSQLVNQELIDHDLEGLWNGKSSWRSGEHWSDKPQAAEIILVIQRLFALMTHTKRSYLDVQEVSLLLGYEEGEMISWSLNEPNKGCHRTYETIAEAWRELSWVMFKMRHPQCEQDQRLMKEYELEHRLFHWKGHKLPLPLPEDDSTTSLHTSSTDNSTTSLILNTLDSTLNDIYSCIDAQVWLPESNVAHFLDGTSQVIAFEIDRKSSWGGSNSNSNSDHLILDLKTPFKLEAQFWVDRYLLQKRFKIAELREEISRIEGEADVSLARRNQLSQAGNKDLLTTLKATIDYLSTPTQFPTPALIEREAKKKQMLPQFQESLKRLEAELLSLDEKAKNALAAAKAVFDIDEMRQVGPHELCSVVVSDGFSGREHMWTYIKTDDGRWFKVLDQSVTEVSLETVLSDPAGLHMNSGHIFAMYVQKPSAETAAVDSLNVKLAPHLEQAIIKDNEVFGAELLEATALSQSGSTQPVEDVEMSSDSPRSDVADAGGPLDLDLPTGISTPDLGSPLRLVGGAKAKVDDESGEESADESDQEDIPSDDDDLAELGFLKKIKKPLKIKSMTGKVGGRPIWLDPLFPLDPNSLACPLCGDAMSFLMQLNAPDDSNPDAYFRTIYVFICEKLNCLKKHSSNPEAGSIKVFRTQLSQSQLPDPATTRPLTTSQGLDHRVQPNQTFPEWEIVCDEEPPSIHLSPGEYLGKDHNLKVDPKKIAKDQDAKVQDTKASVDQAFLSFQARISRAPKQILRYLRVKSPELEPVWASEKTEEIQRLLSGPMSKCSNCGETRTAEFQILSTLIAFIEREEHKAMSQDDQSIDFGTMIILTCPKSCGRRSNLESSSLSQHNPFSDQDEKPSPIDISRMNLLSDGARIDNKWIEESCLVQFFSNDGVFTPTHRSN